MTATKTLTLYLLVLLVGCSTAPESESSENESESESAISAAEKEVMNNPAAPPNAKRNDVVKKTVAKAENGSTHFENAPSAPAFGSEKNYVSKACGMKFVRIEPGKFIMGTPKDAFPGWEDERQHPVEITKPFYLGVTEVTRAQWRKIKRTRPWNRHKPQWLIKSQKVEDQSRWPAGSITWGNAKSFLEKLSTLDGRRYRLPTEAEWEYACRAGTTTHYFCGKDAKELYEFSWMRGNSKAVTTDAGDYRHRLHTVGLLKPNPWGLYDMSGNAREWCEDWYDREYYLRSPQKDPVNNVPGAKKVLRGGGIHYDPIGCRSAVRANSKPDKELFLLSEVGFRVVCEIVRSESEATDLEGK